MKNTLIILGLFLVVLSGCSDDDTIAKISVEKFTVALNTSNAVPMVSDRSETGTAVLELFDDNSLDFSITVDGLSSSDALTAAHVHLGDPVSTGAVAIGLVDGTDIAFAEGMASGTLMLDETQVNQLKGKDIYVNVHSTESPAGLVRGQIDQTIDAAYNVTLSPKNQVPTLDRNEGGLAIFRLAGSELYYSVSVSDLASSDAIVDGHIHKGAADANGEVLINLKITSDVLGISKNETLTTEQVTSLKNDKLYVNIHSAEEQPGLLRGQIR